MIPDVPVMPFGLALALVGGALMLLSILETARPLRRRRERRPRHAARNVATFVLAQAVSTPLRLVLVVPVAALVADRGWGLIPLFGLPAAASAVLGIVLLDASLWAWHVANHRVAFLWRFHAAHHADLDLDATTALRFHFGELALSVAYRAIQVLVIGVGPGVLVAWELLTILATIFHHANVRLPERLDRALAHVLPTPRMHGIHHSIVRDERDSNFGILLSAWDLIFRTLRLDVPQDRIVIGLPELQDPAQARFWTVQALPFRRR